MNPSLSKIEIDFGVSRETSEALLHYAELLTKWTKSINLVSKSSLNDLWTRHILDSAQVYSSVEIAERSHWADLGSGGGLPGAIVAILSRERSPSVQVTCVESDQRKAAFLRTVSRETGCRFNVLDDRIEAIDPLEAGVISARALAPLAKLLEFASLHLRSDGCAVFPKGTKYKEELIEAKKEWNFNYEAIPSVTDSSSVLLKIRDITRV